MITDVRNVIYEPEKLSQVWSGLGREVESIHKLNAFFILVCPYISCLFYHQIHPKHYD